MSKPFFNAPDVSKFFARLKTLPNIPAFCCCVLRFLSRFDPIVPDLLIVTFEGTFSLLTLPYLSKKDHPPGNVIGYGVTFRLSNILFLYISPTSASFTIK